MIFQHMYHRRLGLALGSALAVVLSAGIALAAGESLSRGVVTGGGGTVTNGQHTMRSVIAQPVAGTVQNGANRLCAGSGCGPAQSAAPTDGAITGLSASNDGPTVVGSPTQLSATVSGGDNISYSWTFGDGQAGSGQNPTHTYAAGVYTATVTAQNGADSRQAQTVVHVAHAVVEVRNNFFAPATVTIAPGQRVAWKRVEGFHNVAADGGGFGSGAPSDVWTAYSDTFAQVGDFPYHCDVHRASGMVGTVVVQGNSGGADDPKVYLPLVTR